MAAGLGFVLVAAGGQTRPVGSNYDEAKVPAYTLPTPLLCADGTKVRDARTWEKKRRPELLRLALAVALAKEHSGEAQLERVQQGGMCECRQAGHDQLAGRPSASTGKTEAERYVEMTEQRFNGVRRCC